MSFFSSLFDCIIGPQCPAPRLPLRDYHHAIDMLPEDYTVIDLETSGLDACTCEILEIAAIRYRNHDPVAKYRTYVRPEGKIPARASQINHITWPRVCGAPNIDAVKQPFLSFLGDDVLIGYNIGFDIKFIQTRMQIDIKNPVFDVYSLAREMLPGYVDYRLDTLRHELSLGGVAHTSLGDCEATAQLYLLCCQAPQFERYMSELISRHQEEERLRLQWQAERQVLLEKKSKFKANLPSTKELHQISAQMTGTAYDYVSAARTILNAHDRTDCHLRVAIPEYGLTRGEFKIPFFGAKTSGRLRYIYLSVPCEKVSCSYVTAPTTDAEFPDGTRIYIPNTEALDEISDILLSAYDGALPYFCDRQ